MLFISKWGKISPESDWCWFKLVLGSSLLLLRGYTDLSLAVGHVSEYPHSGMPYFIVDKVIDENIIINCQDYSLTASMQIRCSSI